MDVVEDFTGEEVAFPGLEIATLIKGAPTALEDEALFKEASPSLWEQHVASCLTLLLLILADAPLAEENLDKQVVPGCSCTLFCFADEVFTSSSQEQIVAARLASRPLLPTGVAEASERDGLGGEAAFSSDGIAEIGELSGISSVTSSLSQQRRCSASFCIRVLTEEAAAAPSLEFGPLLTPSSGAEAGAAKESLTPAGA